MQILTRLNSGDHYWVQKGVHLKNTTLRNLKARHSKQQLLIAAEFPPLHRITKYFNFLTGMSVNVTCLFLRQNSHFGNGPIYMVFPMF